MEITLTTPALLFPAISLLLVAYTNRFNTISARIRALYSQYKQDPDDILVGQIESLRKRVYLIRNMQAFGVASLFSCVLCLFILFAGKLLAGKIIFSLSLILMMISLGLSFREILISVQALNIELSGMQKEDGRSRG
ncbi:MAG: DUF2721 domain-containing protein [Desulfobulbaceae bacterium]|uniref:DUF2721 domain-containing protein n=1 Tax=Candidatus Desulfatifera sulfidica TaxID=2841691 RepID=A0A8J6TE15_9BACT|nr:DUF2721 domain-containing protein [Candidatus Desulfatifera sulfidica]